MARPKSTAPTKERINLTISRETKAELDYLSAKEARRLSKQTHKPIPTLEQTTLDMD